MDFDAKMLDFVRTLVRARVMRCLELAEKGGLMYEGARIIDDIILLENFGFIEARSGKIKFFVLTKKGEKLKKLLIDLAMLVYGDMSKTNHKKG